MNIELDIESLREDLINYYGTATSFYPVAYMDLIKVEKATDEELIQIAIKNNMDLNNYIIDNNFSKKR